MPSRPRLLQVVLSLHPGGTERLVMALAERLHGEMPTAVCCLDERGAWAPQLEARGIEVHALGRRPGFHPSLGLALARVARHHRATVVHAHHYSPFVYGALARLTKPSLRLIFTEHGRLSDSAPSSKRRLANRWLGMLPDAVYAVSANLREHIVAEGFSAARVGVIYNGIDVGPLPAPEARVRMRAALAVPDDVLVIGTVARLDPVKDLGTLITSIAGVAARRPVLLVVVGDGPERAHLESRTAALGAESIVRFLGQRDDARDWLAACDLYVNSSITEGVSLTILEAMAAGLPVIATRVGGTPEIVEPSWGLLVPARDASALEHAIARLGDDVQKRVRLGAEARRAAETRFQLDRMVAEYCAVYARVTTRG